MKTEIREKPKAATKIPSCGEYWRHTTSLRVYLCVGNSVMDIFGKSADVYFPSISVEEASPTFTQRDSKDFQLLKLVAVEGDKMIFEPVE